MSTIILYKRCAPMKKKYRKSREGVRLPELPAIPYVVIVSKYAVCILCLFFESYSCIQEKDVP